MGLCCQKLHEVEALTTSGDITDVLLTNEIVGDKKLQRLDRLLRGGKNVAVLVDNLDNAANLSALAAQGGYTLSGQSPVSFFSSIYSFMHFFCPLQVYIEVNVGQNRCGIEPSQVGAFAR